MKKITHILLFLTTIACGIAHAGTQMLGFDLGVSTLEQVKSALVKQTRISDAGLNKFSGGPMLKTDGSSYEIEGVTEVVYVFDDQKKLAAVLMDMDMDKNRFDAVFKALSAKYKVSAQQRPFVGNQFARFKTPDAVIELNAPHLSFQMSVNYVRTELMAKFNTQSTDDAQAKTKRESAKF